MSLRPTIWKLGAGLLGLALSAKFAAPPSALQSGREGPTLPQRQVLKTLFKSQLPLVCDYFWLETIQQVGKANTEFESRDIYFYADLVTDLDRKFKYPYFFGAVSIPFNRGRDDWANELESTALVDKGLTEFPLDFNLKSLQAYNLTFLRKDYKAAARVTDELSRFPNAPPYLKGLATRLYSQTDQLDTARALAINLMQNAENDETREFYKKRVLEIDLEAKLRQVDAAARKFAEREGRLPSSIGELVAKEDLPVWPTDPLGGTILLDGKGRAGSTSFETHRLEVIDQDKQRAILAGQPIP